MPAYDYRCLNCRKRFAVFMSYSEYGTRPVKCPHCGSDNVERRIGRVRIGRSDDARMTEMADPAQLENIDRDPRTLGRMMRQMSGELDQDMGSEFNEVVSRLEKGESPEAIERAMPDLGSGEGSDSLAD
ncbi:MAG: FmdB family zinc ribbon protein [Bellilinea sp.]